MGFQWTAWLKLLAKRTRKGLREEKIEEKITVVPLSKALHT